MLLLNRNQRVTLCGRPHSVTAFLGRSHPSVHDGRAEPWPQRRRWARLPRPEPTRARESQVPTAGPSSGVSSRRRPRPSSGAEGTGWGTSFCQRPPGVYNIIRGPHSYPLTICLATCNSLPSRHGRARPTGFSPRARCPHPRLRECPLHPRGDDSPDPWVPESLANPHVHFGTFASGGSGEGLMEEVVPPLRVSPSTGQDTEGTPPGALGTGYGPAVASVPGGPTAPRGAGAQGPPLRCTGPQGTPGLAAVRTRVWIGHQGPCAHSEGEGTPHWFPGLGHQGSHRERGSARAWGAGGCSGGR